MTRIFSDLGIGVLLVYNFHTAQVQKPSIEEVDMSERGNEAERTYESRNGNTSQGVFPTNQDNHFVSEIVTHN